MGNFLKNEKRKINIKFKLLLSLVMIVALVLLSVTLYSCNNQQSADNNADEVTVTDDANRDVKVPNPKNIKKVFFTSGLAEVYITAIAPDLIGGTCSEWTKEELKYQPPEKSKVPYLGKLNGNDKFNREVLLKEGIEIIFSISGVPLTTENIDEGNEIQEQTGIPVILVDGSFDRIPTAFNLIGEVLGRGERAAELYTFCKKSYETVKKIVETIPDSEKKTIYYAEGEKGLQTEPKTSQHIVGFTEAGAISVSDVKEAPDGGMSDVSLEQVIKWDPDVIIALGDDVGGGYSQIKNSAEWQKIKAVQDNEVFVMPSMPFSWCDRPPGVNRLLGLHWVLNLLYPDKYSIDINEYAKNFFKVLYQIDISDKDIAGFLKNSKRK